MIVSTPKDLIQMSAGAVPEAVTGVLTNLQENPVSGGEGDKAYKFQNATLTQDGASIRVVFSNRPDVPQALAGQKVIAKCKKNDKGLYGLKRKQGREYQGKRPDEIWVYAGAELSSAGSSSPESTSSPSSQPSKSEPTGDAVTEAKKRLIQMGNAMSMCYDTALWVAKTQEEKNDYVMTEAQVQAMASSFFIKSDRDGVVSSIPKTPIK
tara:strand:+ start:4521 stop:5147 length:627 start_codon:yes stop_codon:yes gene_type:complete